MSTPRDPAGDSHADGCAELRAAVEARCAESHQATAEHDSVNARIRELRRDLVAAQHRHEQALAADDSAVRGAEKAAGRDTYQMALRTAETDAETREATGIWARAMDRVNRKATLAHRAVSVARIAVEGIDHELREADRLDQTARLHADQAEAACLDARVRLAACEEDAQVPESAERATVLEPHAATGGHAVVISATGEGPPLVIESIVSGDRVALELAAARIAEHTGLSPAESQLQLQELADAVVSAAAADGYLVFDAGHRFWSGLAFEEARDVINALARLGFVFEPAEGWHSGRAPAPRDLSMALAYAGLDARNMHDLPGADELRVLPDSIGVDARAFLATVAPDLTVDHVVHALGRRASQLEPLWNEWGQVRPTLLSDRHALGSIPG